MSCALYWADLCVILGYANVVFVFMNTGLGEFLNILCLRYSWFLILDIEWRQHQSHRVSLFSTGIKMRIR